MNQTESHVLPCKLTDAEIQERGEQLAKIVEETATIEAQAKAAAKQFKASIEALDIEANSLTSEINSKQVFRNVEIELVPDYEKGLMNRMRVDTGEWLKSRKLTPEEIQEKMFV